MIKGTDKPEGAPLYPPITTLHAERFIPETRRNVTQFTEIEEGPPRRVGLTPAAMLVHEHFVKRCDPRQRSWRSELGNGGPDSMKRSYPGADRPVKPRPPTGGGRWHHTPH